MNNNTLLTITKELEKYNKSALILGLEEKKAKIKLGYGDTRIISTTKELKKFIKEEINDDFIDSYLNSELIQSGNCFNNSNLSMIII